MGRVKKLTPDPKTQASNPVRLQTLDSESGFGPCPLPISYATFSSNTVLRFVALYNDFSFVAQGPK